VDRVLERRPSPVLALLALPDPGATHATHVGPAGSVDPSEGAPSAGPWFDESATSGGVGAWPPGRVSPDRVGSASHRAPSGVGSGAVEGLKEAPATAGTRLPRRRPTPSVGVVADVVPTPRKSAVSDLRWTADLQIMQRVLVGLRAL
jgi:hypothetical protein